MYYIITLLINSPCKLIFDIFLFRYHLFYPLQSSFQKWSHFECDTELVFESRYLQLFKNLLFAKHLRDNKRLEKREEDSRVRLSTFHSR